MTVRSGVLRGAAAGRSILTSKRWIFTGCVAECWNRDGRDGLVRPSLAVLRVSTDAASTFTGDALMVAARATYAVIWSHKEAQPVSAGRLEIRDEKLALH